MWCAACQATIFSTSPARGSWPISSATLNIASAIRRRSLLGEDAYFLVELGEGWVCQAHQGFKPQYVITIVLFSIAAKDKHGALRLAAMHDAASPGQDHGLLRWWRPVDLGVNDVIYHRHGGRVIALSVQLGQSSGRRDREYLCERQRPQTDPAGRGHGQIRAQLCSQVNSRLAPHAGVHIDHPHTSLGKPVSCSRGKGGHQVAARIYGDYN